MTGLAIMYLLGVLGAPECKGIVSGRVMDSASGEPLDRTRIASSQGASVVRSDSEGRYRLEGLCPGQLQIRAVRHDYALREVKLKISQIHQIDIYLYPILVTQSEDLIVQAPRLLSSDTRSVVSLDSDALSQTRGKNLADTLAALPGVTVLRSGNAAKPIVRGQHGSRVLMLFDGVRHEGQDWGLQHGPEIDPFAAGAMHVVKGSAGVRYGPDAIAGVLLVEPPKLLTQPGLRLETQTVGALNGRRGTFAARLDGNPSSLPELSWRLDGNYSRGAALETPTYPLDNTGIQEWNVGGTVEYRGDCWSAKISYRRNDNISGACLCVRKETTEDFDAQVLLDKPAYSELYRVDYEVERPYYSVTHDIVLARGEVELGDVGELETTYAFQRNKRSEFEIVRVESDRGQHNFTLRTHTVDVLFRRNSPSLGNQLELEGLLGFSGMLQENVYRGWPLLSDYRAFGGGIFALERLIFDHIELEAGARFDHTTRHAYLPEKTYQSLAREGRITPESCETGEDFTRCNSAFNAATFSLGALAHISESLSGKLDLSSATRVPTIDEQYLNGTSPSFPVMARGDHTLKPETSWSLSATLSADWSNFKGELAGYGSFIEEYIYLAPELREDGTVRTDVLIQGRFPRFSYSPIDALFYGIDADASVRVGPVDIELQGGLVRARNTQSDEFLLFIPPDRLRTEISYRLPNHRSMVDSRISLSATLIARQYNVSPQSDFAPVPDEYALFGASASTTFELGGQRYLLSMEVQNMLNQRYRDYTSLLRYFADEPGRQVFVRFGTEFGTSPSP